MTDLELYDELCRFISPERRDLFDRIAPERTRHVTVVLEDIYQAHNASAVVRSCDLLGVQDMHVIEDRNKYVVSDEVAMGSSKWVDVHRHPSASGAVTCLDGLRAKGCTIVATTPAENGATPQEIDLRSPLAFCFGTELTGISDAMKQRADVLMRIPMYGFTSSYNISVSVAIVLYTVITRLRASKVAWRMSAEEINALKLAWLRISVRHSDRVEARIRAEAALRPGSRDAGEHM